MGLRHAHRAHLVKPHVHTAARKREGGFAARQPRADHIDDWKTHRKYQAKASLPTQATASWTAIRRKIRKDQNEEAPQRKNIRRFLARPPPPSSPETIGGGSQKRSTIVS